MKYKNKTWGKVFLVGAGPGDPGLITVKGLECIKNADVVIYDYLASPALLKYVPKNCELIYVGKKGGEHNLAQDEINRLLVEKARLGQVVTRLKGGDPFIFGRGGEEAEFLVSQNVPFELVSGVTSAIAAPAYAGIPLTHRDFTSTLAFVTGHESSEKGGSNIDWPALARGIGTIVFLMGVKNLPHITRQLMDHGMRPDTPVALVRWGTTPQQATVSGRLDTIVNIVTASGFKAPAIIVVGNVVKLRDSLQWFEKRPLFGKRIVVTRAREQASDLVQKLSEMGAECLECPTIKVIPADDGEPLDRAIENISSYDWLIFTSVNGVHYFFKRLLDSGRDVRSLGHLKTVAIGPATAEKLFDFGIRSDILPKDYHAESLIDAFSGRDIQNKKILFPRAKHARPILPAELKKMGARVDDIIIYQSVPDSSNSDQLIKHLTEKAVDMITFTSSSTVKNFLSLMPADSFSRLLEGVTVACIGPITADTARKLGFTTHVVAETYTIPGLCEAIAKHFGKT